MCASRIAATGHIKEPDVPEAEQDHVAAEEPPACLHEEEHEPVSSTVPQSFQALMDTCTNDDSSGTGTPDEHEPLPASDPAEDARQVSPLLTRLKQSE